MKERIAAEIFREGDKQNYLDYTFLLLSQKKRQDFVLDV